MGGMPFDLGFLTALLWTALWIVVRQDADTGWPRRVWVVVGIVAGTVLAPEVGRLLLFDTLGLNPLSWWWLLVLLALAFQGALFAELLRHHLQVPIPKALLTWGVILAMVAAKDGLCYHQYRAGPAAFAWHLATGADLVAAKPAATAAETARALAERDREMAVAMQGLKARGVILGTPAVDAAPPPVKELPRASLRDAGWEAAKAQLHVKGKAVSGRRVVLFVNDTIVGIGDAVSVDDNGRRYVWKLTALAGDTPRWQPQGP